MYDDELIHYGVRGMKWGRRRGSSKVSSGSVRGKRVGDDKHYTDRTHPNTKRKQFKTKNQKRQEKISNDLNKMSDKELRDRINRMQMEQQYKKMMTPEKSAARKQVEQILINEGKNIATQMLREEIKKAMKN